MLGPPVPIAPAWQWSSAVPDGASRNEAPKRRLGSNKSKARGHGFDDTTGPAGRCDAPRPGCRRPAGGGSSAGRVPEPVRRAPARRTCPVQGRPVRHSWYEHRREKPAPVRPRSHVRPRAGLGNAASAAGFEPTGLRDPVLRGRSGKHDLAAASLVGRWSSAPPASADHRVVRWRQHGSSIAVRARSAPARPAGHRAWYRRAVMPLRALHLRALVPRQLRSAHQGWAGGSPAGLVELTVPSCCSLARVVVNGRTGVELTAWCRYRSSMPCRRPVGVLRRRRCWNSQPP